MLATSRMAPALNSAGRTSSENVPPPEKSPAGDIPNGEAQGTAITYQGMLKDAGVAAIGIYDLRFALYDAESAGARVSELLTNSASVVSNGLFTVALDFGPGVLPALVVSNEADCAPEDSDQAARCRRPDRQNRRVFQLAA